jgi:hypothetical protein
MLKEAEVSNVLPLSKRDYKAFDAPTGDKQEGFYIRTRNYGTILATYGVFFQAHFDDECANMVLLFAHQQIRLRGHGLDELAESLRLKTLQEMREFDGRKHLAADIGVCVIQSVEVFSKTDESEAEERAPGEKETRRAKAAPCV